MMPLQRLTEFQKGEIAALFAEGLSKSEIGRRLGINESVVRYNLRKLEATGSMANRPVGKKPRVTSKRTDRRLKAAVDSDRFKSASQLKLDVLGPESSVSLSTVRRRLYEIGLHGRVPCKKPYLKPQHMADRLTFAQRYGSWTKDDWWPHVLWSDESKFNLRYSDAGPNRVWRRQGERYAAKCMVPTFKFGGGRSVMVWGCFSRNGLGVLHRINGIMTAEVYKKILIDAMIPSVRKLHGDQHFIFQQDNDPKHTASLVQDWLYEPVGFSDVPIEVLFWPAQSPDLNPIENLWRELNRERKKLDRIAKNPDELWAQLQEAWQNIKDDYLEKLVDSMPERCRAVIEANGGSIRY